MSWSPIGVIATIPQIAHVRPRETRNGLVGQEQLHTLPIVPLDYAPGHVTLERDEHHLAAASVKG